MFFGVIGGFVAFVPLDSAVVASGVVRVSNNRQIVQHASGGVVDQILVQEGARVSQGQALLRLRDTRIQATGDLANMQRGGLLARVARLEAEEKQAARLVFPPEVMALREPKIREARDREQALFEVRRRSLLEQQHLLAAQHAELGLEVTRLAAQIAAQRQAYQLIQSQLGANQQLFEKGMVSTSRLQDFQRVEREYAAKLAELSVEQTRLTQRQNELSLRASGVASAYSQNASVELRDVSARIADLEQQLRPTVDAADKLTVRAPVAGEVFNFKINTVGEVVGAGAVLLEIVPQGSPLIVEAIVLQQDIQHVHVNAPTELRFSAFNHRTTPNLLGKVIYVSPDRVNDREQNQSGYLVKIEVDPQGLKAAGDLHLTPGMSASVFIQSGRRTLLRYLLAPVMDGMEQAMREP